MCESTSLIARFSFTTHLNHFHVCSAVMATTRVVLLSRMGLISEQDGETTVPISSCWQMNKNTFMSWVQSWAGSALNPDVLKRRVHRSVWYSAACAPSCFFRNDEELALQDQRFGHPPAGRQIEDLQVIKSGTCTAEATQSCTNCACARTRISHCLHGFLLRKKRLVWQLFILGCNYPASAEIITALARVQVGKKELRTAGR